MRVQVVRARVPEEDRERYLRAWAEWSGTLLPMGIDAQLLEDEQQRGRFVEITWFQDGEEAAAGDDRLTRAAAELEAASEERSGDLRFYRPRPGTESGSAQEPRGT